MFRYLNTGFSVICANLNLTFCAALCLAWSFKSQDLIYRLLTQRTFCKMAFITSQEWKSTKGQISALNKEKTHCGIENGINQKTSRFQMTFCEKLKMGNKKSPTSTNRYKDTWITRAFEKIVWKFWLLNTRKFMSLLSEFEALRQLAISDNL